MLLSGIKQGSVWIVFLALLVAGCDHGSSSGILNGLNLKLMKKLITESNRNVAVSPFVVTSLLSQTLLGAKGTTRTEMATVLGAGPNEPNSFLTAYQSAISDLASSSDNVTTSVFNGIYVKDDFPIKQSFSTALKDYYGAEVSKFSTAKQAADDINTAVAKTTNNLIEELVSEGALGTAKMVLVSALYFKGLWLYEFPKGNTESEDFLTSEGSKSVQMMKLNGKQFKYIMVPGQFDAIALPYRNKDYSMIVLRPLEKTMTAVQTLQDSLDSIDIAQLVGQMQTEYCDVSMPRFQIKARYDDNLKAALQSMGIKTLFTDQADLSGMSERPLKADKIILEVFMNVTEDGTEAAGAGAISFTLTSLPVLPTIAVNFIVDRSFVVSLWNTKHNMSVFEAYVDSAET